jgi:hypothetical protein
MSCVIYDHLASAQYLFDVSTVVGPTFDRVSAVKFRERAAPMIDGNARREEENSPAMDAVEDSPTEPSRDEERGEASEPDAPTAGVENAGFNTILEGGLGTGVQTDAEDER